MPSISLKNLLFATLLGLILPLAACNSTLNTTSETQPFVAGAIPDQDPEKLQRLYSKLATYLEQELGVPVEYKAVTDYAAAVTAFKVGDLDMVWFGGLTGVQARLQVPGSQAILQRDIDEQFHSVFIANKNSGLTEIKEMSGLQQLKDHSFTFGSESSTSGRLMPQYFLKKAEINLEDFQGKVGFSGSHDKTIKLVESGTYEAGVLNEQVWQSRVEEGAVDLDKVQVIWRSPAYYDYHWVINPQVKDRYGEDFVNRVQEAFLNLDPNVPQQKEILELFGAAKFVPSTNQNYDRIEAVGREIGKIK